MSRNKKRHREFLEGRTVKQWRQGLNTGDIVYLGIPHFSGNAWLVFENLGESYIKDCPRYVSGTPGFVLDRYQKQKKTQMVHLLVEERKFWISVEKLFPYWDT